MDSNRSGGGERNPSWLTGVVLPKIATGAATLLSSFISPHSSSSSSEDDDSDIDSSPSDGSGNERNYSPLVYDEAGLNTENGNASMFDGCLRKESQLTIGKSETKHLIEKLIVQETFSREERDSLIGIINSRVIGSSTIEKGQVIRSDIPDLCNKAIMEAKQWIEEKKEASNSKLKLAHGNLNSVMLSQDNKEDIGSPVDMAKAYMRDRPPWSSISRSSVGEKTPSVRREISKEEVPYGSSFSSSKRKASSLSGGSWNIQDELRRVRCKATEDILKTVPSKKYTISSFEPEPEDPQNTSLNSRMELGQGDRFHDSILFPTMKSIDASSDFTAARVRTSGCLSASAADITQLNSLTKNSRLKPVAGIQSSEEMVDKDTNAARGLPHSAIQEPVLEDDLRVSGTELRDKAIECGFSLSEAREVEKNLQPSDDRNQNAVSSSHDKLAGCDRQEEICQLLSETSVEVPGMNETYDVANDNPQSNSIRFTEEPVKTLTRANLKQGAKGKSTTNPEKGQSKKFSRYNKKTRGKD